jgi:hypothetical protein
MDCPKKGGSGGGKGGKRCALVQYYFVLKSSLLQRQSMWTTIRVHLHSSQFLCQISNRPRMKTRIAHLTIRVLKNTARGARRRSVSSGGPSEVRAQVSRLRCSQDLSANVARPNGIMDCTKGANAGTTLPRPEGRSVESCIPSSG